MNNWGDCSRLWHPGDECHLCLEAFNSGSPDFAESVRRELYMLRYQTRDLREYRGAIRTLELIWGDS